MADQSLIDYGKVVGGSLQDFQNNPALQNYLNVRHFGVNNPGDVGSLLNNFSTNPGAFDAFKANTFDTSSMFKDISSSLERYNNFNNPNTDAQTKQAAIDAKNAGLQQLSATEANFTKYGIDPSTVPDIQKYRTAFNGSAPSSQVAAATVPQAQSIPFKQGLTSTQQASISALVSNKPSASWNETDKANWNYATNNAPLPSQGQNGQPSSPQGVSNQQGTQGQASGSIPFINGLTDGQKASITALAQGKDPSLWTAEDLKNWNFATGGAPKPGTTAGVNATVQPNATTQQPQPSLTTDYIVKAGDSLSKIANTHGVDVQALIKANPQITNPNLIYTGQSVKIPGSTSSTPVSPTVGSTVSPGGSTQETPGSPTPQPQTEQEKFLAQVKSIRDSLGLTPPTTGLTPVQQAISDYKEVATSLGLTDIKASYDATVKAYAALQNQKADEASKINADPWLTEGNRVAYLRNLDSKYDTKLKILTDQQTQFENMYNNGRLQANEIMTTVHNNQSLAQTLNTDILNKVIDNTQKEIDAQHALDLEAQKQSNKGLTEVSPGATLYDPKTGKAVYTAPTTKSAGGSVSSGSSGISALGQAVIDHPELYSQLTPTQKASLAPQLAKAGFDSFGKNLSESAIVKITQSQSALYNLNKLKDIISANQDKIGPIVGLEALNPYSEAKKVQANLNLVKQNVGKSLEGGVLKKEDEEKYKQILATLTDTPSTALYKTDNLIQNITNDLENFKNNQSSSGRDVSGGTPKPTAADDAYAKKVLGTK